MNKKEIKKGKSKPILNTPKTNKKIEINNNNTQNKINERKKIINDIHKIKSANKSTRLKTETKSNNQNLENKIKELNKIIEEKNKEIKELNEANDKNIIAKQKEIMDKESKIENINKEKNDLIKKNEILNQTINELKELNINPNNINTENNNDINNNNNILKKYEDENILLKQENIELKKNLEKYEKNKEIKETKLNNKLNQILSEEKFEEKMRVLTEENTNLKKANLEKEKIIEKLEIEIEKYDYQNNNKEKINELNILKSENEELKQMYKNMTEGINEANKLYNEKLLIFNKEINQKNNKLIEYKNKILVLKRKINEMYEEMNIIKGNSSVNNTSFFSTSFINNSIINTNQTQAQKSLNNTMTLNRDINLKQKSKKKLTGLIPYNSQTINRNDILKNNNNFKTLNPIKKKIINTEIISPQIKKVILFPQTPIINNKTNRFNKINTELKKIKMKEFVDKNKEEENKNINFLKEYKEILEKLTNNINTNLVNKNDK